MASEKAAKSLEEQAEEQLAASTARETEEVGWYMNIMLS